MKNKTFLFLFTAIIFTLFLFPPVKMLLCGAGIMTQTKIGNEIRPELTDSTAWYASVQNAFERMRASLTDMYCNYLPFYNDIIMLSGSVEQKLNEPIYLLLEQYHENSVSDSDAGVMEETSAESSEEEEKAPAPDEIVSFSSRFIKKDATHAYYLISATYGDGTQRQCLDRVTVYEPSELKKRFEECVSEMIRITEYLSTEVNVYFYSGSRFQDSPELNVYLENEYATEADRDNFLKAISPYAKTGYLHLDTLEDRFNKIFLTDHHWNAEGIREGYADIHDMIRQDWADIGDIHEPTLYTVDGLVFNGSFSRLANFYRVADIFSFYDYSLDKHTVYGGSFEESKNRYLSGNYDSSRGVTHYEAFYSFPSRVIFNDNNTGHNLLIIGDSFARAIAEPLASHFDTTIVRQIWDSSEYDLPKVLQRYQITDVLILLFSDRMMYNLYGDMYLDRLLTPQS